jgi:hypothetical protein
VMHPDCVACWPCVGLRMTIEENRLPQAEPML